MKKLFLLLSSLSIGAVGLITPSLSNSINNNIENSLMSVSANIKNITFDGYGSRSESINFRTDPINLSAMGIHNKAQLKQYKTIELTDLKFQFGVNTIITHGYLWGTNIPDGDTDYGLVGTYEGIVDEEGHPYYAQIWRKSSTWFDEQGNYKLALVYNLNCLSMRVTGPQVGRIQAQTGSFFKIY